MMYVATAEETLLDTTIITGTLLINTRVNCTTHEETPELPPARKTELAIEVLPSDATTVKTYERLYQMSPFV